MLASLTSGALGIVGGIIGNNASARQAAKQMDFQREMSDTAHQREVKDLRLAGLNPILSGSGGMGASTPSGSAAPQSDVVSPAIASALKAFTTMVEADKIRADTENVKTQEVIAMTNQPFQARLMDSEAASASQAATMHTRQAELNSAMSNLVKQEKLSEETRTKILSGDLQIQKAGIERAKTLGEIDATQAGEILRWIERISQSFGFHSGASISRNTSSRFKGTVRSLKGPKFKGNK